MYGITKRLTLATALLLGAVAALYGTLGRASSADPQEADAGKVVVADLAAMCQPAAVQAIASRLSIKVTLHELPRGEIPGPYLTGGAAFTPASKTLPACCQVTGSFVSNAKTGKNANFLATFPAAWNQKYQQLGCGGHCGTFAVSDAASPTITITITNQGKPGDSISKGYASFATDEGHAGFVQGKWAIKGPGQLDQDALDDFLYRADQVLAHMGKEFTSAFYAQATGKARKINYSYFCGCSGGGRDALVAASYFPEESDGIVAGSAYANMANQETPGDHCFTQAQIETVSALLTAVTDAEGHIVQPGYTVSELQSALLIPPHDPQLPDPWPDTGNPATGASGGMGLLGDAVLRVFTHHNEDFHTRSVISFRSGGSGQVTGYRVIVPASEVAKANAAMRMGIGDIPENAAKLIKLNHKLLIWANLSDQLLNPYMSINYYKRLAKMYGGYDKLQKNIRLFGLPGTAHIADETRPVVSGEFRLAMNRPENCPPMSASEKASGGISPDPGTATLHFNDVDSADDTKLGLFNFMWAGLRIVDLRDPAHAVEVAYFRPGDGCGGHVRYMPKTGQIWLACAASGFYVLKLKPEVRERLGLPKVRAAEFQARERRVDESR